VVLTVELKFRNLILNDVCKILQYTMHRYKYIPLYHMVKKPLSDELQV